MPRKPGSKNRGTATRFKGFEGRKSQDIHLRLTRDMLLDPVFLRLSSSAKVLYCYIKLWAKGTDTVSYAASLAKDFMDAKTFRKARNELVEAGFIDYPNKHRARDLREVAEYKLSSRWLIKDGFRTLKK